MEQDLSAQAPRSRLAQFFAWVRGTKVMTQQAQTQKSDRQVADGYTRGNDDPDTRSMASRASAQDFFVQREQQRLERQQSQTEREETTPRSEDEQARLRAALEVAQRQFEAQQRNQGRPYGRGR